MTMTVTRFLADVTTAWYVSIFVAVVIGQLRSWGLVWLEVRVSGHRVSWTGVSILAFFVYSVLSAVVNVLHHAWLAASSSLAVLLMFGLLFAYRFSRAMRRLPRGRRPAVPVYRIVHGREERVTPGNDRRYTILSRRSTQGRRSGHHKMPRRHR